MEVGRQVFLSLLPRAMEVVSSVLRALRGTSKIQTVVLATMSAVMDKSITSLAPVVLNIQLI